jgi:hypothetical protein
VPVKLQLRKAIGHFGGPDRCKVTLCTQAAISTQDRAIVAEDSRFLPVKKITALHLLLLDQHLSPTRHIDGHTRGITGHDAHAPSHRTIARKRNYRRTSRASAIFFGWLLIKFTAASAALAFGCTAVTFKLTVNGCWAFTECTMFKKSDVSRTQKSWHPTQRVLATAGQYTNEHPGPRRPNTGTLTSTVRSNAKAKTGDERFSCYTSEDFCCSAWQVRCSCM